MDGDGIPDGCDSCMMGDADNDGVCDNVDICIGFDDRIDTDGDGIPDGCDTCTAGDADNDGICDDVDICPQGRNDLDLDLDGVPDACDPCPVDFFDDFDGDGICDSSDRCQGSDDNIDTDGDGIPNGCDACPNDAGGDSDGDGICDSNDICPNGDDTIDNDSNGIPDACESSYCEVQGNSQYEWIEDVKLDDVFNPSGDNGGYADFTNVSITANRGSSIEVWITSGFTDDVCALSHYAYIDWNNDGDFDDLDEFVFLTKSRRETGATVTIPNHAVTGSLRIRLIVAYGRVDNACDTCIDGEIEDYTLVVADDDTTTTTGQTTNASNAVRASVEIVPNPVQKGTDIRVRVEGETDTRANALMIDLDGNFISRTTISNGTNLISTRGLRAGIYIIEYNSNGATDQTRVIIQD